MSYEKFPSFPLLVLPPPVDRKRSWSPAPILVGRTVYHPRKSPIVTLYEPSVGLFINIHPAHLHTCNHINTQLLSLHAKLKLTMRLRRTALNPWLSRHLYNICVTWHIAMSSKRAHINNNLYCGPTVQPCRITTRVKVDTHDPFNRMRFDGSDKVALCVSKIG